MLAKIVYLPLGIFYYKANKLENALNYLIEGIDFCRKLSLHQLVQGENVLALLYDVLGDSQKALITIREIIRETSLSVQTMAAFENTALEAELLLRQRKIKTAINWAEFWQITPGDKPTLLKE